MAYNIDCTKATIPEALEVLADAVLNPKFQSWEVAEQVRGRRRLEGSVQCGGGCRRTAVGRNSPQLCQPFALLTVVSTVLLQLPTPTHHHPPLLQIRKMEADLKNLADNPQTTLLEGLHSVAYTGGLGRPLIVPDGCLGGLNAGEGGKGGLGACVL